jgi:L-glyceraldehyde 3-phosphate reductase
VSRRFLSQFARSAHLLRTPQGLLTDRYLDGIPADSRVRTSVFLNETDLDPKTMGRIHNLNDIARRRGQSLAQMSLAWALRDPRMTSLIIGASRVTQLEDNIAALDNPDLSRADLDDIDATVLDL